MKSFQAIQEERGEKAFKQAIAMGLKYGGFGYWKDPQTGETKFKTENDTLVAVEPEQSSELAGKGGPDSNGMADDQMGMGGMMGGGGMGNMMGAGGMLQMPGQLPGSGIQGAPEPGEETPEEGRKGWEPGPDGDTCAGPDAQDPAKVPKDTYVGTTNYAKWVAGPDGDNMNTVSAETIREQEELPLTDAGYEEKQPTNRAKKRMRRVMGLDSVASDNRTDLKARSAVAKMRKDPEQQNVLGKQIASMMRIQKRKPGGNTITGKQDAQDNEDGKENDMWRKALKLPAIQKDAEAVKIMNQEARGLVKDPDYKMDQFDDDEDGSDYLDEGAFGQVFEDRNGNVVKRGALGPGELKALHAMKDNPAFPTLINARFDEPFKHKSSYYNNPMDVDNERRGGGGLRSGEDYWDPDEQSDFDKKFPTAMGTYAMTQAKGSPLFDAMIGMDDETKDKMMRNFWRARGDMHKAGYSHNDMHGGNIFVDPDTGEVNIIDLGLAKEGRLSALMEGLGGMDFEEGEDTQLSGKVSGAEFTERMQDMSVKNRGNIEQTIMDSVDTEDEDEFDDKMQLLTEFMRGGIRMKDVDFDAIKEDFPHLADDENVGKLIKMLYDGIGNSELADRMGDAFERKQLDTKVIRAADQVRKRQGLKPINVTNKNVIPPKNMDFDD
jgi:hypothetical protein